MRAKAPKTYGEDADAVVVRFVHGAWGELVVDYVVEEDGVAELAKRWGLPAEVVKESL